MDKKNTILQNVCVLMFRLYQSIWVDVVIFKGLVCFFNLNKKCISPDCSHAQYMLLYHLDTTKTSRELNANTSRSAPSPYASTCCNPAVHGSGNPSRKVLGSTPNGPPFSKTPNPYLRTNEVSQKVALDKKRLLND